MTTEKKRIRAVEDLSSLKQADSGMPIPHSQVRKKAFFP